MNQCVLFTLQAMDSQSRACRIIDLGPSHCTCTHHTLQKDQGIPYPLGLLDF